MKFEMVEPPEGIDDDALSEFAHPTSTDEHRRDPKPSETDKDPLGTKPIGQRMAKAVSGVRASLNRLRAHVIEQDMAEVRRIASGHVEIDPGAEFHPHRFTPSPDEEDR